MENGRGKTKTYRVESNYFCAAFVCNEKGLVIHCAPILKYMMGWSETRAIKYAQEKGWWFSEIEETS